MKKCAMIVAVAGLASALQAAPLESITFTGVASKGRQGDVTNNQVRTWTPTATGNVAKITVTGSLSRVATNTWSSQSMILVTPPGGAASFIIQPYTSRTNMTAAAQNVPANSFTVPVGAPTAANAGEWTFAFFESSWEGRTTTTADATWDTVTLTLDDAAPALQALPGFIDPTIQYTFDNVPVNTGWNMPLDTHDFVTFTPTESTVVDTVVVSGISTGTSLLGAVNTFNLDVGNATWNYTPTYSILVRVKPPVHPTLGGGFRTARFAVNPLGAASSTSLQWSPVAISGVDTAVEPAGSSNPAIPANTGEWKVEFLTNVSSATNNGAFKAFFNKVRLTLVRGTPPDTTIPVTLVDGSTVNMTGTFAGAGETKWYKFHIGATTISRTTGTALDLGMVGTSLTPENDACFGVYNSGGAPIATSFNTGPGILPQISFGKGIRNAVGDGVPFDGANPGRSPAAAGGNYRPDLTTGDYYLAVANGDDGVVFNAGLFSVTPTTETNVGDYTVNFRSWLTSNTAPFDVPNAVDLGTVGGPLMAQTFNLSDTSRFQWYKFTLAADASDATGKYIDIDTVPTPAPINDTNIAVYDSTGLLKGLSDDINAWTAGVNDTGGNSALSFGSATPVRDYSAINADLAAYPGNGVEGPLTAGTYYLQVSMCCATYTNDRFWVINDYVTGAGNGAMSVNIRNNYDPIGSACGPADLGGTGGVAGFDNHLDNNDFIVYIDNFFNHLPSADIGTTGGVAGSDGAWDNNDFIVYIDQFFAAPASCR